MEKDAKDLARGIVRADWLQFSSEKQEQRRRDREKEKIHYTPISAPAHVESSSPSPTTTHIPADSHKLTLTHNSQRKNPNLQYYHLALVPTQKSTTLRLQFFTFLFLFGSLALSIQEAQNSVLALRASIPCLSFLVIFFCFVVFLLGFYRSQELCTVFFLLLCPSIALAWRMYVG